MSEQPNLLITYRAQYVGGHVEYPKPDSCFCKIYTDEIGLCFWNRDTQYYEEKPSLVIPYLSMTNIENADQDRISALRVVMLGIIGALWKKKHIYTVIQYKDQLSEKTIVLDFDKNVDEVQPLIYKRMVESRENR